MLQWATRAGGAGDDTAVGIAVDGGGNAYLAGSYSGASATFGTTTLANGGGRDVVVAKLSTAGSWQWASRVGGSGDDFGQSIAVDASGNAYVAAYFNSSSLAVGASTLYSTSPESGLVARYSTTGTAQWATLVSGSNSAYANAVALDTSGNPYLLGDFSGTMTLGSTTLTSAGGQDTFVTKLSASTGAFQWASRAGGVNDDFAPAGSAIVVDATGNAYITGRSYSTSVVFGSTMLLNPNTNGSVYLARLTSIGHLAGRYVPGAIPRQGARQWPSMGRAISIPRATLVARQQHSVVQPSPVRAAPMCMWLS
ncbi:SBBP repeat-containing protein [Hymenobacter sp. BRD67]|uniref:SBBP repeat-containing protein n=1 Tax=Hymenobacter sp. BRD67 TaxID=2675877 RepID=UPI001566C7D1|nr:SBBP repeat-containing protein [Hymenobacter sp. BRD67]QKG54350.1 SBBP repeat-containing protein [Hymenobacter sp. BRD67]